MQRKFKLSEESEKQVEVFADLINDYETAIELLSRKLKIAQQKVWEIIGTEYPESVNSMYISNYNHKDKELIINKRYGLTPEQKELKEFVGNMIIESVEKIITDKIEEKFNQE